jgi:hypothetical protein
MKNNISPLLANNAYEALLFNKGLIRKLFLCASTLMSHAKKHRLSEILARTDGDYPECLLNDEEYLKFEVIPNIREHAKYMGSRICQDWSGVKHLSPEFIFSPQERDVLNRIFEQHNSNMQDYNIEFDFFHDEMVVSHNIATAFQVLSDFNKRTTHPTLSVRDAIEFAVKTLPDTLHNDSDIFNFCIKQIQNALGQDSGDNAGVFFSGDAFFDDWEESDSDGRKQALMRYVQYEIANMGD